MSRDKYSGDHTVTVNEGAGTFTVNGNFRITGEFDLSSFVLNSNTYQRIRLPGVAFRPDPSDDANVTYNSNTGRLSFTATSATVFAAINDIPHGAFLYGVRIVGAATGASDTLNLSFRESDGSTSTSLSSITLTNEGAEFDIELSLFSGIRQMDYTNNKAYFFRAVGQAATTEAYINYVDLIYYIRKFPQDSEGSPT